jgi:hypothetical protein
MDNFAAYNAVKDQMRTGDLLLWQTHNLIGGAIQWATGSIYSHASLVIRLNEYEGQDNRRFTTEALGHGVVLNLLSRRLENQKGHCWWFPLKDEWKDKHQEIGERALSFVGVPYDYNALVKFMFGQVLTDVKSIFCPELVYISWGFSGKVPAPDQLLDLGMVEKGIQIL